MSLNKIRLKNIANGGSKKAALALALSENYDSLLSTILIGNNIVNIAASSLATVIFVQYFGNAGVAIATAIMTVLVLVFGEISPKSLAKESPEAFAMFSAPVINVFIKLLMPVNWLFSQWKKLLSRLVKSKTDQSITEEELMVIIDEVESEGVLAKEESDMLRSVVEFDDLDATDALTPRVDVVAVSRDASVDELHALFRENGFSRLPVFNGDLDDIVGVIHEKDFYTEYCGGGLKSIEPLIKDVHFATQNTKVTSILRTLRDTQSHMAVILDEFGGTLGIVTLEDILELLVGEIYDEHDEITSEFSADSEGVYTVQATADPEDLLKLLGVAAPDDFDFATVGSWVVSELEKIPEVGDSFTFGGATITVTKTDAKRLLEITAKINAA